VLWAQNAHPGEQKEGRGLLPPTLGACEVLLVPLTEGRRNDLLPGG
jgi:hypothetical protein